MVLGDYSPLRVASWLKLYCVLAMQMGSLSKPMALNLAMAASASGLYETPDAPYVPQAMASILSCQQKQG